MEHNVKKDAFMQTLRQLGERLKKYKYACLVLALGIVLMLFPAEKEIAEPVEQQESTEETTLEERLECLLSQVEGAGEVRVILTLETGAISEYQQDSTTRSGAGETQIQTETVLVEAGGEEMPIPVKTTYPTYKGAVVVCQGADRASVKLALVRAVSCLTGLGSDQITVIKMKAN